MTGRNMTAEEGYRLGVVNRVVEPDVLLEEALDLAQQLARRAPYAVREAKRLVNQVESHIDVALSLSRPRCRTCTKPKTLGRHPGIRREEEAELQGKVGRYVSRQEFRKWPNDTSAGYGIRSP